MTLRGSGLAGLVAAAISCLLLSCQRDTSRNVTLTLDKLASIKLSCLDKRYYGIGQFSGGRLVTTTGQTSTIASTSKIVDTNDDGVDDSIVIIFDDFSPGNGSRYSLYLLDGKTRKCQLLHQFADRDQVSAVRIQGVAVIVSGKFHRSDDPSCCATDLEDKVIPLPVLASHHDAETSDRIENAPRAHQPPPPVEDACPGGVTCGNGCCPPGTHCTSNGGCQAECPPFSNTCGNGCCPRRTHCCWGRDTCCPDGSDCCFNGGCCPRGSTCTTGGCRRLY